MSDIRETLRRSVERHQSFAAQDEIGAGSESSEAENEYTFESVTTAFDGVVEAAPTDDAARFSVTVTVPLLGAVTDDEMADIVVDGWYETFERRVTDMGSIFRTSRELTATVSRDGDSVVVETAFTDRNVGRGVDDASAFINFVEGTYVQGVIPGYTYTDPVAGLLEQAREAAGSGQ